MKFAVMKFALGKNSLYFDLETYAVLTHQQIPLLLAKSALSCWMYSTAQIALSPTPSYPWDPPE